MTGLLGMALALGLLMGLAYLGASVLLLAPVAALVAVVASGGAPWMASYTQVFMPALGQFIVAYFPVFLLGAVFGKLMEDSGAARAIAQWFVQRLGPQRAVLATVLGCALLTYGGVSLFVVAFAVYPIAAALFRAADIPKRLIPATIALGAFTFTMTALPGTPAIQNAIPMPYFGTTPFAAPGLGIIGAIVMFALGLAWLQHRTRRARSAGEGYGAGTISAGPGAQTPSASVPVAGQGRGEGLRHLRPHAEGEGFDVAELGPPAGNGPSVALATLPIVLVIACNYVFSTLLLPRLDTSYLALPVYGATGLSSVLGLWSIVGALLVAIGAVLVLQRRQLVSAKSTLGAGANAAVLPIFNTASMVGFGAVMASLPAFAIVRDFVLGLGEGQPLISLAVAVNILAGITGSASGGMSIALSTLGDAYLAMGQAAGVAPEVMHRVTSIATGGLDALPHNGAVITLLGICGLTHRQSYGDLFVVAVVGPILALVVVIALAMTLGAF